MEKHITTPITQKITKDLKSGDSVYITGAVSYTHLDVYKRKLLSEMSLLSSHNLPLKRLSDRQFFQWLTMTTIN